MGVVMSVSWNVLKAGIRLSAIVFLVFFLSLPSGCKSWGKDMMDFYFDDLLGKSRSATIDKTAEQLALDGMQKMKKKDYDEAIKDFKKLKEHYPYSKYAILAELKLGDAYFHDKKYGEAGIAYEEFVRLHPRNEVIPYVLYQVGMSHFLTFTSVDRDPEETHIAMQSFEKVMQNFPKSDYARRSAKSRFRSARSGSCRTSTVWRIFIIYSSSTEPRRRAWIR